MSKAKDSQTLNSLQALSILLPANGESDQESLSQQSVCITEPTAEAPEVVADDRALLQLASTLKQSLQSWREQLARAPELIEQVRRLRTEKAAVEARRAELQARMSKQKGWHALQKILDAIGTDNAPLDPESARLAERAKQLLADRERQFAETAQPLDAELQRLTSEIKTIEGQPAVQAYLAEQRRLAEHIWLTQRLEELQIHYADAHRARELESLQTNVRELLAQTQTHGALHGRAEQLLAMVETDLEQARQREAAQAARTAREQFGRWIHTVSKSRAADDLVLTFGLGQAVHLTRTGEQSHKGNARVALVSAIGFALSEPVVRTLIQDEQYEQHYRLQPATDLPARGRGRRFDWQYGRQRKSTSRTGDQTLDANISEAMGCHEHSSTAHVEEVSN